VVLMTAPSNEAAAVIVRTLVEEGVVACGNIIPGVTSIYRWQGDVHTDREVLVLFKTTLAQVPELLVRAPALHPYEVPELLVLAVDDGHGPYLTWLRDSVVSAKAET
jgi:periplasmic divalent cation tolerance protein